jgi:RimJ/RimL family protein N-acetyltransferase
MRWALQTVRLRLRPATDDDAARLHAHWTDPDVGRYLFDGESVSRETVADLLARSNADFERDGFGLWIIEDRHSGDFVGMCCLAPVDDHDLIEILYSLEPAAWGNGIATESAEAVLRYAFTGVGLDLIVGGVGGVGGVGDANTASRRVLEHLGMRPFRALTVHGTTVAYYAIAAPS